MEEDWRPVQGMRTVRVLTTPPLISKGSGMGMRDWMTSTRKLTLVMTMSPPSRGI